MHDVYTKFCVSNFGAYVDRKFFLGVESPGYNCYTYTIDLMNIYADMIYPFYNLWPNYNFSGYIIDYFATSYVIRDTLPGIIESIECEVKSKPDSVRSNKIGLKNI